MNVYEKQKETMSASWWLRCSSFLSPFFTTNQTSIHRPEPHAGCWDLAHTPRGPGEPHPLAHPATGRQDSAWAVGPAQPPNHHQTCPDPSRCGRGETCRVLTCGDMHTSDRMCTSPVFPRGASSTPLGPTKHTHKKQSEQTGQSQQSWP